MKKILTIATIILLVFSIKAVGQTLTPKWESCFGGSLSDEGYGIVKDGDNFIIVARSESSDGDVEYNRGLDDILIIKTDSLGNLLKANTIGGTKSEGPYKIIKVSEGQYFIAAQTNSSNGDISNNPWPLSNSSLWGVMINQDLEIEWESVYGGDGVDRVRDSRLLTDSSIVNLTVTTSQNGDISNPNGDWDLWAYKINSSGQLIWEKSLGGEGYEIGGSIIQTSDMGYLVVGGTDGAGGGNFDTTCNFHGYPGGASLDVWVVKLDSNKNIEWQQCYGGSNMDVALNVIELSDSYIILANTSSDDGDVNGYHGNTNDPYSLNDFWVLKIDKQGNLLWQHCYGGYYNEFAENIFSTSDGGYMLVGSTTSDDGDVEGFNGFVPGGDDVWFVKLDYLGNLEWQYCYGEFAYEYIFQGVIQINDWDFVLSFTTESYEWRCYLGETMNSDIRAAQLYDSTLVGINQNHRNFSNEISVELFPNPATEKLIFTISNTISSNKNYTLSVYDVNGKMIENKDVDIKAGRFVYDVSEMKAGVYFYKLSTSEYSSSGKFVVNK